MAIARIGFHVLAVGQGNGTFVVYYDDQDRVVDVVIMDFGSDTSTISVSGPAAVGWAVTLLDQMRKRKISAVFFSHSDYDHISLMARLLKKYPKGRSQLPVGRVFYGGAYEDYRKYGSNVLAELERYTDGGFGAGLPPSNTSFAATKAKPLVTVGRVDYYLLIANTATMCVRKRKRSGYYKNSDSMITIADDGEDQFVMSGDATGAALIRASEIIDKNQAAGDHLENVYHTTIPHHGSYTTAEDIQYFRGHDWEDVLSAFVKNLKAQTASATAGVQNKHKHPSAYIFEFFWKRYLLQDLYQDPVLPKKTGRHYYTAYFTPATPVGAPANPWPVAPASPRWETMQTRYALFTNDYWGAERDYRRIVPPTPVRRSSVRIPASAQRPGEVHWEFLYDYKDRSITIHRIPAYPSVVALGEAIIAGVAPDELPETPDWYELIATARAEGESTAMPKSDGPRPRRDRPDQP